MKIRAQFILTVILTGMILLTITGVVIFFDQKILQLNEQVEIASSIQQDANDLGYLANDYLLYQEDQQLSRWESRFSHMSSDLDRLNPQTPEQRMLVENIRSDKQRLETIFNDIGSNLTSSYGIPNNTIDVEFIRISWDRINVQSQSIISNALQLTKLFQIQENSVRQINIFLIFILTLGLVGSFIINYVLVNNRLLKTVSALQESEEKYRFLFEKMSQPFLLGEIIFDEESKPVDFVYLEVNKAWEKTMGFSKNKIIGKRAYQVFPNLDLNWIKLLGKVVTEKKPIDFKQFGGITGKWFDIKAYPQKGVNFAAVLDDITQQKIQEEKILNLSKFPSENPNPVLRIGSNLKLDYANKPGIEILRILGAGNSTIPKVFAEKIKYLIDTNKNLITFDLKINTSYYEFTLVSIKNADYFNIYGRNITEERKAEKIKTSILQDKILNLERKKIARELHDTVSQNLFSSSLFSESILKSWNKDPESTLNKLKIIKDLNNSSLLDIRILLNNLMPERIINEKLKDLIGRSLDYVEKHSGLRTKMISEGDYDMSKKMKFEVYRIFQESLNNIVKHSKATMIEVRLWFYYNNFKMVISDNGRGFDLKDKSTKKSFGLNIMKERARLIGASLDVKSSIEKGTTITLLKKK